MRLNALKFASTLLVILAMATGFAHLFAFPNKIDLPAQDYLTDQQIYRGWAFLGIIIILAILSTLVLSILLRKSSTFIYAAIATASMMGTQVFFWAFTYPANRATNNWTVLPSNWEQLR